MLDVKASVAVGRVLEAKSRPAWKFIAQVGMQLGKEARPGPWNGLAVCDYTFDGQQEDARQAIAGGKQQL